jgi:hypothetical protein
MKKKKQLKKMEEEVEAGVPSIMEEIKEDAKARIAHVPNVSRGQGPDVPAHRLPGQGSIHPRGPTFECDTGWLDR